MEHKCATSIAGVFTTVPTVNNCCARLEQLWHQVQVLLNSRSPKNQVDGKPKMENVQYDGEQELKALDFVY